MSMLVVLMGSTRSASDARVWCADPDHGLQPSGEFCCALSAFLAPYVSTDELLGFT